MQVFERRGSARSHDIGWHYIGRLRHRTLIQIDGSDWFDNRRLLSQASERPQRFKSVTMVASNPWHVDLVLYRKTARWTGTIESSRRA